MNAPFDDSQIESVDYAPARYSQAHSGCDDPRLLRGLTRALAAAVMLPFVIGALVVAGLLMIR